jgi:ribonucleoside-triphosphate reductase (formate)
MDISIKLYQPFVTCVNRLREKYGEEFEHLNGFHNQNLNFTDFIDNFVDSDNVANATIDSNANANTKDICSLTAEINKPHTKLLAYNKIFYEMTKKYGLNTAQEWLEQEWNGAFYLHDAPSSSFKPYCFAYDLEDLVNKGLFFVNDFKSEAPKHLLTYVRDVLEFVSWTSNRTSGACGLPNFLIYSYYFWYNDVKNGYYLKSPEYYRDQGFQEIIYGLNQPYLRVNQSAFTNFTIMDRPYLAEIFGSKQFPDGSYIIDHIEELIEYQKAFMEEVSRIRENSMFTFPVITYSLLYQNGKFVDEEFARWCNKHNMKWCDSNFFVSGDVTSLSSCCRLVNDFTHLKGFINSIGGTALKIGSVKVNTINLVRIALESKTEDEYITNLKNKVDICVKTLDVVRNIIKRNVEKGLLPNYTYKLIELKDQYNTIGINGMYEAIDHFGYINTDEFGNKFYSEKGIQFASKIMDTINEQKDSYNFDYSINVEAVPAERCAAILYAKDKLLYPNEPEHIMYGNQWIPLDEKCTLNEKIKLGAILDKKCGGGQIAHINLQGPFNNEEQAWNLLNYIAKSGVIYFAYNLRISVCKNGHGFIGKTCPHCGEPVEDTYQRVVGFLTPSHSYSKERKHEFSKRYWYNLNDEN